MMDPFPKDTFDTFKRFSIIKLGGFMKKLILILSLILSQSTMAANFQEKNKTVIDAIIKAADRAEIPRELLNYLR